MRSSRTNLLSQSPMEGGGSKNITPKSVTNEQFKSLSNFINDNFNRESERYKPTEYTFPKFSSGSTPYYSTNVLDDLHTKLGAREDRSQSTTPTHEKSLTGQFPLSKIYEIQDLFYNVSDKEFNELQTE